jgi:hypothetical protein
MYVLSISQKLYAIPTRQVFTRGEKLPVLRGQWRKCGEKLTGLKKGGVANDAGKIHAVKSRTFLCTQKSQATD